MFIKIDLLISSEASSPLQFLHSLSLLQNLFKNLVRSTEIIFWVQIWTTVQQLTNPILDYNMLCLELLESSNSIWGLHYV